MELACIIAVLLGYRILRRRGSTLKTMIGALIIISDDWSAVIPPIGRWWQWAVCFLSLLLSITCFRRKGQA
jgi:predicted ABC-type sugar transport system permease subunit